jgi:hypothetical protein
MLINIWAYACSELLRFGINTRVLPFVYIFAIFIILFMCLVRKHV